MEALTIFNERVASANEVANEIGEDVNLVAYHVKELRKAGCLELVKTEPRGGTIERFYRAVRRPELDDEEWWSLSDADRKKLLAAGYRNLMAEGLASIHAGKMSKDRHMRFHWKAANLDAQGREEAAEEQEESLARLLEIEARACERMLESGEEERVSTVIAVVGFTRSRKGKPLRLSSDS